MNLSHIVKWGCKTLEIVDAPSADVLQWCTRERLEEKFGWLRDYREPLARWFQWLKLIGVAEQHVRLDGLTSTTAELVRQSLTPLATTASEVRLAEDLADFVAEQCTPLGDGERLPGTTEPLESAFGKQKSIEGTATKTGFTSLLVGLGAIVGRTTAEVVHQAMETCGIKHVRAWRQQHLGTTLRAKRRIAYAEDKKSDESPPPSS
jgi:hypothetical protein